MTVVVYSQEFVVRNDSPCGSTIGPIMAAKLGVRTIGEKCLLCVLSSY